MDLGIGLLATLVFGGKACQNTRENGWCGVKDNINMKGLMSAIYIPNIHFHTTKCIKV